MAPNWSYIGAGAIKTGSSAVVPVPAGYAAGDLLVICSNGALPSTPTGWTAISSGAYAYAYYKFAASSESSVTLAGGSAVGVSVMLCYRQILSADTSAPYASYTNTTIGTNTQTTTATDDLVISIFGCPSTQSNTITAPGSTTTRINQSAIISTNNGLLIVDEDKAASGVTTSRIATFSTTAALGCISFSFKQKPKVGSMLLMF